MNSSIRKYFSLVLKLITAFFALSGVYLCLTSGTNTFMGNTSMLMYFTIQSNILIAIVSLIGIYYLLVSKKIPLLWQIIKYVSTVAITLTGVVFCFVLAPTMGNLAWSTINVFTHVIVPIAAVLDFFVVGVLFNIERKNVLYTIIPPILYLVYASIGYICNWEFAPGVNYPYFFLNWGSKAGAFGFTNELPFLGCFWWIMILLIFIVLVGLLYLWILKLMNKDSKNS